MNPDYKSCCCMGSSNSEGICQQNDNMAKEYCGLIEEPGNLDRRPQPFKLEEYHREKESSYPTVFVITGDLALAFQWSIITIPQRVVLVLCKHLPLFNPRIFLCFFFLSYENQEMALIYEDGTIIIYTHTHT